MKVYKNYKQNQNNKSTLLIKILRYAKSLHFLVKNNFLRKLISPTKVKIMKRCYKTCQAQITPFNLIIYQ